MKIDKNHFRGIITADLHLRKEAPRCRIDDNWMETQKESLQAIVSIANKKKCPVFAVGDIFDTPRAATEVVKLFIQEMRNVKKGCYILAGNHGLIGHAWHLVDQTSFGILMEVFPLIESIYPQAKPFNLDEDLGEEIMFTHQMVFADEKSCPPNVKAKIAQDLLDEYPSTKWIFTGDVHNAFHHAQDGRHVVNPGCINIQNASMKDYTPKVAFVDTEKEKIEWIELPNNAKELVDDSYLQVQHERDDRIETFLEHVQSTGEVTLSFRDNLEKRMKEKDVPNSAKEVLLEVIEELGE